MSQDVPRDLFAKQLAEIQAGCTVLVPRLSQEEMDNYISRNTIRKTSKLRPVGPNFYELDTDSDEDEGDDLQVEITQKRDKPIRTISLMDSDDDDDNEPEVISMRPPERNSSIESHSTTVQSFSCSSKTTISTSVEAVVENPPPSVISEPVHSDTTPTVQDKNNETVVRDKNNEIDKSASQSEAREASKEKSIAVSETAIVVVNSNEITTLSKSCEKPEESNSFSTCTVTASIEATNAVSSSEPVPAENIRKNSVIKSLSELCTTSIETLIPSGSSSSKISTEKAPVENSEKDTISSHSEARETPNETSSSSTGDQPTSSNPSSPITTTADPASSNENVIQSNSKSDESSKGNSAVAAAVSDSNPNSSANTLRSIFQNDNGQISKSSLGGNISSHLVGLKERGIKVTKYNPQSKKNQNRCSTSSRGSISIRDAIDETIASMIPDAQLFKQLENLSTPSLEPLEIAANPSSSEAVPVSSSPSNEPSCSPKIRVKSGEKLGLNHADGENFFKQFIVDSSMNTEAGRVAEREAERVADNSTHILDENISEIAVLLKTMNQSKNSHDTRIRSLKKRMPNGPTTEIQHMEVNAQQNSYRNILLHQSKEIVGRLNTCINYISINDLMPQILRKFCEAMGLSIPKSNVVKTFLNVFELVLNSQAYYNSEFIKRIPADDFFRAVMNIDSTSIRGRKRAAPITNFVPPPQMCENAVTTPSKITYLGNNPGPAYNSTERNLAVVQSSASQNITQRPVITNAPIFTQGEISAYRPNIPSTPRNSLLTMQNSAMNNFGEMIPRMFLESSSRLSALAIPNCLDNTLRRVNVTNLANTHGAIIRGHENVRMMVNQPNLRVATSQGNVQLNSSNYATSPPCYRYPPLYQQHSMGMEKTQNMMRSSDITSRPVAAEIHREIVSTTTIVRPSIPPHLSIPRHQAIPARPNSPIYPNVSTYPPVSNPSIGSIHTSFPGRQNSCVYSNIQAHQMYPSHPSNPTHPAAIPFYNPSMTPRTYSNRYPNAVSPDTNPTMLQNQRPYSPHQLTRAVFPSPIIQRNVSWNECPIQRPQYPPYIHNESSRFQSSQPSFSRHETTPLSSLSSLSGEKPLSVQVVNSTLSPSAGPSPNLVSSEMPISVPIVQSSSSPNVDQICNFEGLHNISTPFLKDSEFEELLKSNVLNMTMEGMDQGNITRENH